jgi:copper chaperone CopZ
MKKMIVIMAVFLGLGVQAQQISKKSKSCKTTLQVNGNCEMCKTRIEKAALKNKGVKYASWNVDSKGLFLIYNEHKTSPEKIARAIAESGHDTDTIEASQARYEQLHFCCQYRE